MTKRVADWMEDFQRRDRFSAAQRSRPTALRPAGLVLQLTFTALPLQVLLLRLAGDDLVLDLVIRGLRDNSAGNKLVLCRVWPACNDARGISVANAVEGLELIGRCGVDVERRSRRGSSCWFGRFGGAL